MSFIGGEGKWGAAPNLALCNEGKWGSAPNPAKGSFEKDPLETQNFSKKLFAKFAADLFWFSGSSTHVGPLPHKLSQM